MNEAGRRPHVAVIGGGPAGLMAAETVAHSGARVTIFDRMPSPGRKLLLAGRGGLNLTHSEDVGRLIGRYGIAAKALRPAIDAFGPAVLRQWCGDLGIETFVGTSGRVFPVSFKTSPLLRVWLRRLDGAGIAFKLRHRWTGFDEGGRASFETPEGAVTVDADAIILALGGASWPQLGSDGAWVAPLLEAGLCVTPLQPANCGFGVAWSDVFRERFEGEPLKSIALRFGDQVARGDVIVSRSGLEGGALYALAGALRDAIAAEGAATLVIALRPDLTRDAIVAKLGKSPSKQSRANGLRKTLGLPPVAIGLLREGASDGPAALGAMAPEALADLLNAVPVRLSGPMPIARAISTAGGLRFPEIDSDMMLRSRPGTFVAGEMLDWEAPTGGYLLQACFATGFAAGQGASRWLASRASDDPVTVRAYGAPAAVF